MAGLEAQARPEEATKIRRKRNNTSNDVNIVIIFLITIETVVSFENGTSSKLDASEFLPIVGFRLKASTERDVGGSNRTFMVVVSRVLNGETTHTNMFG